MCLWCSDFTFAFSFLTFFSAVVVNRLPNVCYLADLFSVQAVSFLLNNPQSGQSCFTVHIKGSCWLYYWWFPWLWIDVFLFSWQCFKPVLLAALESTKSLLRSQIPEARNQKAPNRNPNPNAKRKTMENPFLKIYGIVSEPLVLLRK